MKMLRDDCGVLRVRRGARGIAATLRRDGASQPLSLSSIENELQVGAA